MVVIAKGALFFCSPDVTPPQWRGHIRDTRTDFALDSRQISAIDVNRRLPSEGVIIR